MPGIVLECSQHGDFDSFDVIRSLTSMASTPDSSLPSPIVTGLKTMYYVDNTVVEGGTYYYKFRVWRGSESLVSDEVRVFASNHSAYFSLDGTLLDNVKNVTLALIEGALAYESGALKLNGSSYVRTGSTDMVDFGAGDFTVECSFKSDFIGSSPTDQVLVNVYTSAVYPTWQITVGPSGKPYVWLYMGSTSLTLVEGPTSLLDGNEHQIKWVRMSGVSKLLVDGVIVATVVDTRIYPKPQYFEIGAQTYRPVSQAYYFKGLIKNIGLAKQVI